ncbi:unnamed protein product [Gemmata massiliana]|uniref:Uncharacterized protein n=1 Tax=Gemmata massiliana TaxID=1210884 RepID=A0A6P2CV99_9BACT|nr:unnamed protein product [Gemmata massiliana]
MRPSRREPVNRSRDGRHTQEFIHAREFGRRGPDGPGVPYLLLRADGVRALLLALRFGATAGLAEKLKALLNPSPPKAQEGGARDL